ncbi:MAG: hypothetical protein IJ026_01350 [Candidatus Methanomethylophilaceae archaeon]|nr:hypothetical protein [Candidatus Methanomethylophilaceae archaeon]
MGSPAMYDDWTGNTVPGVTVRYLDPEAVRSLRASHASRSGDVAVEGDDTSFLAGTGLMKRGRLTNSALVLLGRSSDVQDLVGVSIRWRLVGVDGRVVDSRTFGPPMVLAVRQAASMVHNPSVTVGGGEGARTVGTYRTASLTEALFNAVAHQDYGLGGVIDLVEREGESVTVVSRGSFPEVAPESFVLSRPSFRVPRNAHLVRSMAASGLTPGNRSGIRSLYVSQVSRRFPMPRYDISEGRVSVTFPGRRTGPYVRMLDLRGDLPLDVLVSLDRLDRGLYVPERDVDGLVSAGLVTVREGVPMISVDSGGAMQRFLGGTDRDAVLLLLEREGPVDRSMVVEVLASRDRDGLTRDQLAVRATNMLQGLRRDGLIEKVGGSTRSARYSLRDGVS